MYKRHQSYQYRLQNRVSILYYKVYSSDVSLIRTSTFKSWLYNASLSMFWRGHMMMCCGVIGSSRHHLSILRDSDDWKGSGQPLSIIGEAMRCYRIIEKVDRHLFSVTQLHGLGRRGSGTSQIGIEGLRTSTRVHDERCEGFDDISTESYTGAVSQSLGCELEKLTTIKRLHKKKAQAMVSLKVSSVATPALRKSLIICFQTHGYESSPASRGRYDQPIMSGLITNTLR